AASDGLFVLSGVRLPADERVAQETGHLVVGQRPGGLEGSRTEHEEVERGVALRVAVKQARDDSRRSEATREGGHDRCVARIRRLPGSVSHCVSLSRSRLDQTWLPLLVADGERT